MKDVEELATLAIDCGLDIHRRIGSGLLESAYEAILAAAIKQRGLAVERQTTIAVRFGDLQIDAGFRADLIVEGRLLIELKSVDRLLPVHAKQVLTYLRFSSSPSGCS